MVDAHQNHSEGLKEGAVGKLLHRQTCGNGESEYGERCSIFRTPLSVKSV